MNSGHQVSHGFSTEYVFRAVAKGEASKIRRFIREGLDVDSTGWGESGFTETLLIHAINNKKAAIARILILNLEQM